MGCGSSSDATGGVDGGAGGKPQQAAGKADPTMPQQVASLDKHYKELSQLGVGASCRVIKAERCAKGQAKGQLYAVKCLTKAADQQKLGAADKLFKTELKILAKVRNANILELIECMEDSKNYYIVTGLCTGGELFDKVADKISGFSEAAGE
jgi:serine/threonine protein kinase